MAGLKLVVAATLATVVACGAEGPAGTQKVVAVVHLTGAPTGSLQIYDDRLFEYLDGNKQKKGALTPADFDALAPHVTRDALTTLLDHHEADPDACANDTKGFIVDSDVGTGCLIGDQISDAAARADFDAIVVVFERIGNGT